MTSFIPNKLVLSEEENLVALSSFVEILKFKSISALGPSNGSYDQCGSWLVDKCQSVGLDAFILPESLPHKPIVIASWIGTKPELACVILNSHYDVVPVFEEHWQVPAFEGLRKDGRVYGRGTQDMKCVCVQYLTAIAKLKSSNFQPTRSVYLTFVPDEEISGVEGMNILLVSDWFSKLKVGLALDEGLANENDEFSVFYGERLPWWVKVTAQGNTGHGSRFIDGTAVEQIVGVANKALQFRQEQKDILFGKNSHAGCAHSVMASKQKTLGDVTSLNVTLLRAGVSAGGKDVYNVVPPAAELAMDIRISPSVPPQDIANTLNMWCQEVSHSATNLPSHGGCSWELVCGSRYVNK